MQRLLMLIASLSAFVAVLAGAFGAHALRGRISAELLATFETGVRYQMYHALALLGVALAYSRWSVAQFVWAGWLFIAGTVLFSGSLYLLSLTGTRWWGAVTPLGGLCFLGGWAAMVWGIVAAR